jgi:hypothetical protein
VDNTTTNNPRSLQGRHRKLTLKLQYLYAELDEARALFEEAKIRFAEAYRSACLEYSEDEKKRVEVGEKKLHPPAQVKPGEAKFDKKEVKKLFRDIAHVTHPDKLEHMESEEQEFRAGMFEKAKGACEELNWYELSKLAEELKIKIPALSETHVSMMKGTIVYVTDQIASLQSTYAWQWYNCTSEEEQQSFMKRYINGLIHG